MSPLLLASFVRHKFRTSNHCFREAPRTVEGRPVTPLSVSSRPYEGTFDRESKIVNNISLPIGRDAHEKVFRTFAASSEKFEADEHTSISTLLSPQPSRLRRRRHVDRVRIRTDSGEIRGSNRDGRSLRQAHCAQHHLGGKRRNRAIQVRSLHDDVGEYRVLFSTLCRANASHRARGGRLAFWRKRGARPTIRPNTRHYGQ